MGWQASYNRVATASLEHALSIWQMCGDPGCPICQILTTECTNRGIQPKRKGSARTEPSSLLTTTQQKEVP